MKKIHQILLFLTLALFSLTTKIETGSAQSPSITQTSNNQADILFDQALELYRHGDYNQGLLKLEQSLKLYQTQNNKLGQANVLKNIDNVYYRLGKSQKASDYYNQALRIYMYAGTLRLVVSLWSVDDLAT